MATSYERSILDLFTDERNKPDDIRWFIDKAHANYVEVSKLCVRRYVTLAATWAITYAIATGIVEQSQLSVIQISKVLELLVIAPPLLGFLAYDCIGHFTVKGVLHSTLEVAITQLLPGSAQKDLEYLLAPSTFFDAELIAGHSGKRGLGARLAWLIILVVAFVFTGIFAVGHATYLLWRSDIWHLGTVIASGLIGGFFASVGAISFVKVTVED